MSKLRVAALITFVGASWLSACTSDTDSVAKTSDQSSTTEQSDTETTQTTQSFEDDLNEFVVSTTARVEDYDEIDEAGNQIVIAWWYPTSETDYNELADELLDQELITEALANEWKSDGRRQVTPVVDEIEIVKMWPVRVAEDNATFQISSLADGSDDETLTFIEFEKEDNTWKATQIL